MGRNERGADIADRTTALSVQQHAVRRRQPGRARKVDRFRFLNRVGLGPLQGVAARGGWRICPRADGYDASARRQGLAAGKDFYVKQGLYRGGNVGGRTDVFWIGPTARGTSL